MKTASSLYLAILFSLSFAHGVAAQNLVIGNARVIVGNGEVIDRVSGAGGNEGRFHGLHMADVDSLGNLYAGEVFASRVQRFLLTN